MYDSQGIRWVQIKRIEANIAIIIRRQLAQAVVCALHLWFFTVFPRHRMPSQSELKELWLGGPDGQLCALEQLKAWALRAVWKSEGKPDYGMYSFIAERVVKNDGEHPRSNSVSELLGKMDETEEWFPGKQLGEKRGRKRVLVGGKASGVCRAAKAIKANRGEVTYGGVCANAAKAVINPDTGEPVDKRAVYVCLRERCYDKDPDNKWANRRRLGRAALTATQISRRYAWACFMKGLELAAAWLFNNLVWVDICSSILPTTEAKAAEQALARKGRRVWCSADALSDDENLLGDKRVLKMKSWDTIRVWWVPVLTRGKLHVEVLPDSFPGDYPDGAETFVARVRASLNIRFQGQAAPTVLFTDRGAGFYNPGNGRITGEYKAALAAHGLRAFMRDDAAVQPGKLSDLMLHETAVAWIRRMERQTLPKRPWEESAESFATRLKRIVAKVNAKHDLDGLCRSLPARVDKLLAKHGGKLRK